MPPHIFEQLSKRTFALFGSIVRLVSPHFTVGVSGIISNDEGHIYVQRHRFWPRQAWGLPGGFLEHGERPEAAIRREIMEETGLITDPPRLIAVEAASPRHINIYFSCQLTDASGFHLQRLEVIEGRFVHSDQLPSPFLPSHRHFLDRFTVTGKRGSSRNGQNS